LLVNFFKKRKKCHAELTAIQGEEVSQLCPYLMFQHLQDLSDPEINSGWHTKRRSNIKCLSYLSIRVY